MWAARGMTGVWIAVLLVSVAGCASSVRPSAAPAPPAPPRLTLDPEESPIPFRWLSGEAVLVAGDVGERRLAAFGNYVERAAGKMEHARLGVWDDEAAYQRSATGQAEAEGALAHKRAEYVKDAGAQPVERFLVFDRQGGVVYQRDFRSWPLTELD
jgi:hypothetical protein